MFEIIQKISDEALKTCPETGHKVKRVITGGGGVVYKGSGWYVTDYKNRSGSAANRASVTGNETGSSSANGFESKSSAESNDSREKTNGAPAGTDNGSSNTGRTRSKTEASDSDTM